MMKLSPVLIQKARHAGVPQYALAGALRVHRSTLSLWMCGAPVRLGDPHVLELAAMLGVASDQALVPWEAPNVPALATSPAA